jgi:hypothetical protein
VDFEIVTAVGEKSSATGSGTGEAPER